MIHLFESVSLGLISESLEVNLPAIFYNGRNDLQVQSTQTETPLSSMTIGTLEIGALSFVVRIDVPAATSLIRNQWQMMVVGNVLDKGSILLDRL